MDRINAMKDNDLKHAALAVDPEAVTFSEEGVDLTLIRWMLSLTPAERLQVLNHNIRSILRLRDESTGS